MEFGILGPLEVRREGQAIALHGATQRALLAILLTHANRVVGGERLVELLWAEEPPGSAEHALQVYISQLRKILEPGGPPYQVLISRPPGYLLQIWPTSSTLPGSKRCWKKLGAHHLIRRQPNCGGR